MKQVLFGLILIISFQFVEAQNKLEFNLDINLELDEEELKRITEDENKSSFFRKNKWYAQYLHAFGETIYKDSLPSEIFRFTYLRAFDNPIVIRLENKNDTIIINWKVVDEAGSYELGKITESKTKKLTIEDWCELEEKIDLINFWNLPIENDFFGFDGSQWILEGKNQKKYHIVDRWCGQEISSVCETLIKLTDLKVKIY